MKRSVNLSPFYIQSIIFQEQWIPNCPPTSWRPLSDVFETKESLVVRIEASGAKPETIRAAIEDGRIRISGTRSDPHGRAERIYHRIEIPFGEFCIDIPIRGSLTLDAAKAQARYQDGFIVLEIPKDKPRHIVIEGGSSYRG